MTPCHKRKTGGFPILNSGENGAVRPPALDTTVTALVHAYLETIDAEAPGFVRGLYLVGSVALGDLQPRESDIDFVAVSEIRPDAETVDVLQRVHTQLHIRHPRPHFDGVYVTYEDLDRDPILCPPVQTAHEGRVEPGDFEPNPVTWHTLARHGVTVRGADPAQLNVWTDCAVLNEWTLANLDSYWRPWLQQFARLMSVEGVAALGSWAPAWGVLGVSRLHYTLSTGEITSKSGAGHYALETFPTRWHKIIQECLRIRGGRDEPSVYRTPFARRRDACGYMDMVINHAHALHQGQ